MSLYSTGTRVLAGAAWAFCAFFGADLVLSGSPGAIWHFLPSLLLVAWGIYLLLWRPRLLVRTDGLTVVNILRTHQIPFSALRSVRVAQNVSLDTTGGRIASWGAPGAGRLGPRLGGSASGNSAGKGRTPAHAQTAIDTAWNAWERSDRDVSALYSEHGPGATSQGAGPTGTEAAVMTRWDVAHVVVTVILLALVAASVLG